MPLTSVFSLRLDWPHVRHGGCSIVYRAALACGLALGAIASSCATTFSSSVDLPGSNPAATPNALPLERLLQSDGSLDLQSGYRGSISAIGWRMVPGPKGAPLF